METSAELLARINRLEVPHGQLALWSLGQAGFALKGGGTVAYIDPYLSDSVAGMGGPSRRFPPPLDPAAVTNAQVVFATHEHADHADADTLGPLLRASPQALLVTTPQSREIARRVGVADERIVTPALGQPGEVAGISYTAIPAAHYRYEVDAEGRARWMGLLLRFNGVTLYHAGDTIFIPELAAALEGEQIDIALLPINGRDFAREQQDLTGNLWPGEAVELAQRLRAGVLIGIHNDLFDSNRVNPGWLFEEQDRRAPFQRCHILQPSELYLYAG
ncbi:MAG TPA: MBL fold metallo-hydrolase [Roseiflexaceae bacterium]|nr:MBL fold metallo-hydrolase [Roseiflexaceae bacterium]